MVRPEVTGRRPHSASDDDPFLNSASVKARYGGVSNMWLHRRLHDDSEFPQPDLVVKERRFWRLSSLIRWERRRAAEPHRREASDAAR
jgi:hypothetical protein